jgi:hypothetical protein
MAVAFAAGMRFLTLFLLATPARAEEWIPRPPPAAPLRAARQLTIAGAIVTGIGASLAVGAIGAGAALGSCSPDSFGNDCRLVDGVATYTLAPLAAVFLAAGIPMLAVGAHRMREPVPVEEPAHGPRGREVEAAQYRQGRRLTLAGWAVTALAGGMWLSSLSLLGTRCNGCLEASLGLLSGTAATTVIGFSMVIAGTALKRDAQRRFWLSPTASAKSGGVAAGMSF